MAVAALAAGLKAQGRLIIDLGAGEPDFDTPAHIRAAAVAAMENGETRYTVLEGTRALRLAIAGKLERENGLGFPPEQILVSSGAKQSCFNAALAVLDPGDEAIVPSPYWVSYPEIVRLAGAEPVFVPTRQDDGFRMQPEALAAALTQRTRFIFLNSPANPTGAVYSRSELAALGAVLRDYPQVVIASDEIYERIFWGKEPYCSFAAACPDLADRTITINGVSKGYAMTGWRIGYAAGPPALIGAMKKLQGQSTSNACSISQAASAAALTGDQSVVQEMRDAFRDRQDYFVTALNRLPGVSCARADGAFYAFPDVTGAMRATSVATDTAFAELLLRETEVAVVPGTPFGAPGHVRLSYACGIDSLREAVHRLGRLLS